MPATQVKPTESEIYLVGKAPESRAERIRRMQECARALAREEVEDLLKAMVDLAGMADQVATGGDAYAVGIREMASRLQADISGQAKSMEALLLRH